MTDWRTLEAGDELDRYIAERLGWRVVRGYEGGGWHLMAPGESIGYFVCYGAGYDHPDKYTLDEAWSYALNGNPTTNYVSVIPRYSRDTDAALALLPPSPIHITIDRVGRDYWRCIANEPGAHAGDWWVGEADTISLAICRTWLEYEERKG